jgi:hypothetical protein
MGWRITFLLWTRRSSLGPMFTGRLARKTPQMLGRGNVRSRELGKGDCWLERPFASRRVWHPGPSLLDIILPANAPAALTPQDNVAVKGVPCLMGTEVISDWVPNTDATIVTRILESGGTIIGKAVCENLSLWGISVSSGTGEFPMQKQIPHPNSPSIHPQFVASSHLLSQLTNRPHQQCPRRRLLCRRILIRYRCLRLPRPR